MNCQCVAASLHVLRILMEGPTKKKKRALLKKEAFPTKSSLICLFNVASYSHTLDSFLRHSNHTSFLAYEQISVLAVLTIRTTTLIGL